MLATLAHVAARATLVDWLLLFAMLLLALYVAGTWNYDYFSHRGVPCLRPAVPFMGNLGAAFMGLRAVPDAVKELYDRGAGEPVVGIFDFSNPTFMIRDPEVLKHIAVKGFDHFTNHRTAFDDTIDPFFAKNLFSLKDQRWRDMRATLSPAFTTSKLKGMFQLIHECGRQLADHVAAKYEAAKTDGPLEMNAKDVFTRFTNDVIATTAFGLRCDSLKEPDNAFYRMGRLITTFRMWAFAGYILAPRLMKKLGVKVGNPTAAAYFDSLVHDTIRERQSKGIFRPDMLQLLMQARQGGLQAESDEEDAPTRQQLSKKIQLEDDDITAQAIIFFFAGFDTVSTAMCYSVYALATHPDVQRRVQTEVDDVMARTGGKLTYDVVCSMKYLDMVVSEGLRLYPPGSATERQCGASCTVPLPGGRPPLQLQEKELVWVPIHGFHRDPQYWPDPERFDPERFNDENRPSIKPFTYMPFGLGPRICIGQRLALLELKMALLHLVARFELLPAAHTPVPIAYARRGGFSFTPKGGFVYAFRPRAATR